MPDKEGVTENSPAPEQAVEDVNQTADTSAVEPEAQEGQQEQTVQDTKDAVDEFGVPWKNRAMEWKRKTEELSTNIPSLIEQKLSEVLSKQTTQQTQQREYSIAELEQIAINDPQYRPWVEEQKESIRQKKLSSLVDERFQRTEKLRIEESRRSASLQNVMREFPELFTKNAQGLPTGWDNSNPMTIEVSKLMQDERLSKDPDGLLWAAHIAHSRLSRQVLPKVTQEIQKAKAKVKKLESKEMVQGGGRNSGEPVKDSFKKAQERLAQTGSMKDAESAMAEYFKKKGIL